MPRSLARKTRSFMRFNALRDLVSDSMAIDMGSASTIIAVRGRGIVVDEPSVVAVNRPTGEVVAMGREAHEMHGREARDVRLIAPLVDGVVADFERTQRMLHYFVRMARSGLSHFSRRALLSVLSGVTQVEQRALLTAAERARIGRIYMVEEGLAAALGAGVGINDRHASAVIDIGGATTNIAVVARGFIVYARAERIGASHIDAAIADRLRRYRGLAIGGPTAERVKLELGSATPPVDAGRSMTVKGRDVQTGAPGAIEVTAEEVFNVGQQVVRKISEAVRSSLAELPPEVAADIYDRGMTLTGGGALLEGMGEYIQKQTQLETRVADQPRFAIVNGLALLFDEPLLLRRIISQEASVVNTGGFAFEGEYP